MSRYPKWVLGAALFSVAAVKGQANNDSCATKYDEFLKQYGILDQALQAKVCSAGDVNTDPWPDGADLKSSIEELFDACSLLPEDFVTSDTDLLDRWESVETKTIIGNGICDNGIKTGTFQHFADLAGQIGTGLAGQIGTGLAGQIGDLKYDFCCYEDERKDCVDPDNSGHNFCDDRPPAFSFRGGLMTPAGSPNGSMPPTNCEEKDCGDDVLCDTGTIVCYCDEGYMLVDKTCVKTKDCIPPCENGGTCNYITGTCTCPSEYEGDSCGVIASGLTGSWSLLVSGNAFSGDTGIVISSNGPS